MTARAKLADSLTKLLDTSSRPIYAVNSRRQIVYCNRALVDWMGLEPERIVGREVEYHSEPSSNSSSAAEAMGPLVALCPPPKALAGEPSTGTVSCVARDGRLVHRQAEFVPLAADAGGVLVILADAELSPHDLAGELSPEPTADELHRAISRFRRGQATKYAAASLLGESPAIRKARAQAAAAAASGANVLIVGPNGSGRTHVARVIHYRAAADGDAALVPVDCALLTDDRLRRSLDSLATSRSDARHRPTLLLQRLEQLSAAQQSLLLEAIRQRAINARLIATLNDHAGHETGDLSSDLLDATSTITIRLPRLVERLGDLPILAHYFVEACNQGRSKQIGAVRPDALDLLALYSWPEELNELRDVIAAAHRVATTAEITPRDLPPIIHHAHKAAVLLRAKPERIVLDELLAKIERELIERALVQTGGNKTEAATLLGMTRPRLYRRLVQLGLAGESAAEDQDQLPQFVERDPPEPES